MIHNMFDEAPPSTARTAGRRQAARNQPCIGLSARCRGRTAVQASRRPRLRGYGRTASDRCGIIDWPPVSHPSQPASQPAEGVLS